ncbi:MAG: glutamate-1-semialdehyde-2,1-aminomutase [Candidatus Tectomicrobia bacterium RIFCSPLOWO2_12_FULL_69_37]|nr:MAG: glutamate-1-semialdehyde-2,1-aminomutase [Candidatus Tectomicrobia bacterium RIFCSPLOWO2_02_FULL_70_19]OGL67779.1 MAG: glutamate-1-semialdehyde-2,1-aminomutase [Candidatus Tectomicrobia bacterium RIFCSPLOWO2_12_FULL_69_37]
MTARPKSEALYQAALKRIPGGVDSPVRAFRGVGGTPFFVDRGKGSRIWDADGNAYIDYVLSWGPLILGHAHPRVVEALREAAARGTSYGAPTELETTLAELAAGAYPSMEMLRFVNSGTEATMSAIRLARGFTGRDVVVKFEGCYHGHADGLLVKAGSGSATLGVPDSAGVPGDYARHTVTLPYNDTAAAEDLFSWMEDKVAAVIVEPVAGNMGLVPPRPGFLEALRRETEKAGALLIFDEVMSGFRVAWGGAQARYGVRPDLTTLGKVIGGGLPVGAFGGRREVMERLAPLGPVYQAGTLSGNPLAMTAGIETLRVMQEEGLPEALEPRTAELAGGMLAAARSAGVPAWGVHCGTMFCLFFQEGPVYNFADAKRSDTKAYGRFFHAMLDRGVALAPSQFEVGFLSGAHREADVEATLDAARKVFSSWQGGGPPPARAGG